MQQAKVNIVADMLLDSSIGEIKNGRKKAGTRTLALLSVEFDYQYIVMARFEKFVSLLSIGKQIGIFEDFFSAIKYFENDDNSLKQQVSLRDLSKAASVFIESIVDAISEEEDAEIQLRLYDLAMRFNPRNKSASKKYRIVFEKNFSQGQNYSKAALVERAKNDTGTKDDDNNG